MCRRRCTEPSDKRKTRAREQLAGTAKGSSARACPGVDSRAGNAEQPAPGLASRSSVRVWRQEGGRAPAAGARSSAAGAGGGRKPGAGEPVCIAPAARTVEDGGVPGELTRAEVAEHTPLSAAQPRDGWTAGHTHDADPDARQCVGADARSPTCGSRRNAKMSGVLALRGDNRASEGNTLLRNISVGGKRVVAR